MLDPKTLHRIIINAGTALVTVVSIVAANSMTLALGGLAFKCVEFLAQ